MSYSPFRLFTQTAFAAGFLAACVTAGLWVYRGCPGWALALEPCKIRYLVTPTFATLRRNGRSRRFDPIFTIENEPPRPREPPRHPRLLDASQMPPHMVPPPGFLSKDCSSRIPPPGFLPQDSSSRIPPPGFLLQDASSRMPP